MRSFTFDGRVLFSSIDMAHSAFALPGWNVILLYLGLLVLNCLWWVRLDGVGMCGVFTWPLFRLWSAGPLVCLDCVAGAALPIHFTDWPASSTSTLQHQSRTGYFISVISRKRVRGNVWSIGWSIHRPLTTTYAAFNSLVIKFIGSTWRHEIGPVISICSSYWPTSALSWWLLNFYLFLCLVLRMLAFIGF